ncbi:hypothetical protein AAE478_005679 [Parahypoxylon ruwenzoriense]
MASPRLVRASDESGVLCRYKNGKAIAPKKNIRSYVKLLIDIFLPAGYPNSVTPDYKPYQIYDSLQAFSSTIAGLLSSRAVLQGFGVGDSASTATAAVLLTVLQDSVGRGATIAFAHFCGRSIEPECKFYRFFADIVNDSALFLDLLSPALPRYPKVLALCATGVLRALCGASGGAAKASLSAHFAKNGNLAELNAKDGSQETVISLMGMLAGTVLVHFVHGKLAVWAWMFALVTIHLWTNYQAVRSVQMRTLNAQRLHIALTELVVKDVVLRPEQVAARESILTWDSPRISFATEPPRGGEISSLELTRTKNLQYVIMGRGGPVKIFLKEGATTTDVLQAWAEAFADPNEISDVDLLWKAMSSAGWDIKTNALETGPAIRIKVDGPGNPDID